MTLLKLKQIEELGAKRKYLKLTETFELLRQISIFRKFSKKEMAENQAATEDYYLMEQSLSFISMQN